MRVVGCETVGPSYYFGYVFVSAPANTSSVLHVYVGVVYKTWGVLHQSGEEQGSGSIDLRLKEIEADPYSVGVGRRWEVSQAVHIASLMFCKVKV